MSYCVKVVFSQIAHFSIHIFCSGEVAFKSLSLGPFIWAKNPMINRLEMLPKEIPISILYGSDTWMDKTAGYLIQSTRDPSYVSVQVNSLKQ